MFKIFSKKAEKKSYGGSLFRCLDDAYSFDTDSQKFIEFYVKASPVFTATKKIADSASTINILIRDKKTGKFIYDHPALRLINKPNPFKNKTLFIKELIANYLLTGNCYINIMLSGSKPIEIDSIKPSSINIQANNKDGYPQVYTISGNASDINLNYNRDRINNRFINGNYELAHLRDYNPLYGSGNLVGISVFAGCQLEISQYILASIHNNALLKNQARPSGLMTYKGQDALSDEQVEKVREILLNNMSGAANTGKTTFLNGEFNWIQMSQSVKDMDFPALKKSVEQNVYSAAGIPLPMISPDTMTLANMDAATYVFYDIAVLPRIDSVLEFLTTAILSKFPNSDNLQYAYDVSEITALENRKIENTLQASKIGILSINELRSQIGYESLKSGGDEIYQPMNLIPVGSDAYTADNRKPKEKAIFIKTMQDGGYSKEQIQKSVAEYYDNDKSA